MRETEKNGENAPRNGGTHLNFQNVTFEISAGVYGQLPKADLPEIVFSGKSNVGKSSLINKLVNRKALARVSATPGKTATINFSACQRPGWWICPVTGMPRCPSRRRNAGAN